MNIASMTEQELRAQSDAIANQLNLTNKQKAESVLDQALTQADGNELAAFKLMEEAKAILVQREKSRDAHDLQTQSKRNFELFCLMH